MPRFTATISGGTFAVVDTAQSPAHTVLSMNSNQLHQPAYGTPSNQLTATISVVEIDRAFGTPYGDQREMGFDMDFAFVNNTANPGQIGSFGLTGLSLETPIELRTSLGDDFIMVQTSPVVPYYGLYPGDMYSPLIVLSSSMDYPLPYNICVGLHYPALQYNHRVQRTVRHGDADAQLRYRARGDNDIFSSTGWFTIPAGEARTYRLGFRINDRVEGPIGVTGPNNWLWTLRGYQQYFRRLYGKPDYRRMGGWDGRVIGIRNSSSNGTYNPTTNPRRFSTEPLANPSTNGTSGNPNGYYKFEKSAKDLLPFNVERVMFWALSGFDQFVTDDYDPRIATGVLTLDTVGSGVGPTTVRPALRGIRDAMQLGIYWGRCNEVPESDSWLNVSRHAFDPTNAADVARLRQETDLAVNVWRAEAIGLDAYTLGFVTPGDGVRWLRELQKRYPHVLFITEKDLPDVLHVIAPTYFIEGSVGSVQVPFWIPCYLNPGSEYLVQINGLPAGVSQAERADELANLGMTTVAAWNSTLAIGVRATPRWPELGESAIPGFRSAFQATPLSS